MAMGRRPYRRRSRSGGLKHVSEVLERLLQSREMQTRTKRQLCALVWPEIAGEIVAKVSHVSRVTRGTAYVCCESPTWAQELQQMEHCLLDRLAKRLGGRYVKKLRFSTTGADRRPPVRAAPTKPPKPAPEDLEREELPEQVMETLECVVQDVRDTEIRESLLGLLVAERKARQWRLRHGYHPCTVCGSLVYGSAPLCFPCEQRHRGHAPEGGSMDRV
jgi:predicted nucleic acid-binding Zn ribbon protein